MIVIRIDEDVLIKQWLTTTAIHTILFIPLWNINEYLCLSSCYKIAMAKKNWTNADCYQNVPLSITHFDDRLVCRQFCFVCYHYQYHINQM